MQFHLAGVHRRPHYLPLGKPQVSEGRTPPILQGCGGVTSLFDGSQLQRGWGRERRGAADTRERLFLGPSRLPLCAPHPQLPEAPSPSSPCSHCCIKAVIGEDFVVPPRTQILGRGLLEAAGDAHHSEPLTGSW